MQDPEKQAEGMPVADLRFLVAEDHDFQRGALVRVLQGLGAMTVYEAANGHGALQVLRDAARPVDIVISDLDMPGMDGMEFLRHLGEAGESISIILASALERKLLASIATMSEAYGINLLGVVEKPLTAAKLAPLIGLHRPPVQAKRAGPAAATFTLDEIAAGLENDEFEPFFQPKVDLATGEVKSAEALARWRHPRQGIVEPASFIKLLEDNGRVDDLTQLMLGKAAAFCCAWRATGADASVAVNLSVTSLRNVEIAERMTDLVRSRSLDPRHMILEVTESAVTTEVGKVLENLARLRMKGFGLSIDDYGTGYSSMQQLARIAFTELKIDQSFVMKAAKQKSARVILESSIEMARQLNITSAAEGVETRADFHLLCQLRCDMAQGYFIARPMEAADFTGWMRQWKHPDAHC
jgi:EAL domain-containing protein (putative c-di-GMP-specific phosphodiesterase class I)/AmiR/NasT family two-component response regulator